MRNFLNVSLNVCLLATAMGFISCQNEEPFQADIDAERTLAAGSAIIKTMERTTASDGSYDNIVDGASCLSIQFPYAVTVNGSQRTIASMEDLEEVEKVLDSVEAVQPLNAVNEGYKKVEIMFPVTVTLSDYTEIVINSEKVLQEYVKKCVEGGDDADIECVDMMYPIGLFTYNPNLQQTGNVVVNNDKELRRFLTGLVETDLISIDFPLTFMVYDSTKVTVNNNSELAETIQSAMDSCDEDDDNDYNDDDFTEESLDSLLVVCPWTVKKLERMNLDSSDQYQGYVLTFLEDGIVVADNGFTPAEQGNWFISVSDFKVFVSMEFQDVLDFNGNRYTYEIGEGLIKLIGGESGKMILEQICGYKNKVCDQMFIEETLLNGCRWSISEVQGIDNSEGATVDFANKTIAAYDVNDRVVDQGNWNIAGTIITFEGLSQTLAYFAGDWEVIACSEKRFSLRRGTEVVVLSEKCD